MGLRIGQTLMPTVSFLNTWILQLWELLTMEVMLPLLCQAALSFFAAILFVHAYGLGPFLTPLRNALWTGELGLALVISAAHTFLISLAMESEVQAMPAFALAITILLGIKFCTRVYKKRMGHLPLSARLQFAGYCIALLAIWCLLSISCTLVVSGKELVPLFLITFGTYRPVH